ncbi:MAG: class I SAM-dependent methyltransferase [Pseudomonadota bacterium]
MIAPVSFPLAVALEMDEPVRILDVGCGGGGQTKAILDHAPRGSSALGLDISGTLIAKASQRYAAQSDMITFQAGNAEVAQPVHANFDRVVSRFGVMFFEHPERAFRNLTQWVRPNSTFAFAVWAPIDENPWMEIMRDCVAQQIELPKPEPDSPGPFRYADANGFAGLLARCGYNGLSSKTWNGYLPVGGGLSAKETADFAVSAFGIAQPAVEIGGTLLDKVKQDLQTRFQEYEVDGQVMCPAAVHIIRGHLSP